MSAGNSPGHAGGPLSDVTCVPPVGGEQARSAPETASGQPAGAASPQFHREAGLGSQRDVGLCFVSAAPQNCLPREFDTKSTNISQQKAHFISLPRTSERAKLGGLPSRLAGPPVPRVPATYGTCGHSSGCAGRAGGRGSWREDVPVKPQTMAGAHTDLGRPEGARKTQTKANTPSPSFLPGSLVCRGLGMMTVLGPLIINPHVWGSAMRLGPSLLDLRTLVLLDFPLTLPPAPLLPYPKTWSPSPLLSLLLVDSCFVRWRACWELRLWGQSSSASSGQRRAFSRVW